MTARKKENSLLNSLLFFILSEVQLISLYYETKTTCMDELHPNVIRQNHRLSFLCVANQAAFSH